MICIYIYIFVFAARLGRLENCQRSQRFTPGNLRKILQMAVERAEELKVWCSVVQHDTCRIAHGWNGICSLKHGYKLGWDFLRENIWIYIYIYGFNPAITVGLSNRSTSSMR